MKLIVYTDELIYDGDKFYRIADYNFKQEDYIFVHNVKKLFNIFIQKQIKFDINKIIGLEYMNTSVSFDLKNLPIYYKVDKVLSSQKQNLKRHTRYVPNTFIKQLMLEQHSQLKFIYPFFDAPDYIKYHNSISYIFSKIEDKNKLPINFKVYGTITGRVTHEYINKTKADIKKIFGKNIHEFDFTAFEIMNIRSYFDMPFMNDPYDIEGLDRKTIKELLISKIYGMTDENILSKYGDKAKEILDYINIQYKPVFDFKKSLVDEVKMRGYIKIPTSGLRIFYNLNDKYEHRLLNNFFQALSADIMKLKLFMVYQLYKKDKNVIILFPVHDSIYIKTSDVSKIDKIKSILESEIKVNNKLYKHKIHIKEV